MRDHHSLHDGQLRALLGLLLLGVYLLAYTPKINSIDGEAILAVSTSFVRYGTVEIGVIGARDAVLVEKARMGSFGADGALYSKKGVTPSIALLPLVWLAERLPWLDARATAMLFNPLVTAGTAMLLYTLARRLGYRRRTAFLTGLIYGAACLPLPYVKTLYGEPLAALLLLGAVSCQLTSPPDPLSVYGEGEASRGYRGLAVAGVCLGLLVGVNMAYAAVVPVVILWRWLHLPQADHRHSPDESRGAVTPPALSSPFRGLPVFHLARGFEPLAVLALVLPVIIALVGIGLYNWARFGNPVTTGYYFGSGEGFSAPLLTGMFGLTFSPFRGLFWYSPALLLAIPGWLMLRRRQAGFAWLILILSVLVLVLFSGWSSWEGGVVWGPRFLLPVIPLLALCLAPLLEHRRLQYVAGGFALLSLGVQFLGTAYSLYPYFGYLYSRFYSLTADTFAARVLVDPGISAIVGHLVLLRAGWPLEPAWITADVDWAHLLAVAGVIGAGVWWLVPLNQRRGVVTGMIVVVCLNVVAARQQRGSEYEQIQALGTALQPPGTVVAFTTAFQETLVDVEGQRRVVSTHAPTAPDDALAAPMWDTARRQGGNLWLVTWFAPGEAANWQERDLWQRGAFAYERQVSGHRALLFSLETAPDATSEAGHRFGAIRLERYGAAQTAEGVLVTVEWTAEEPLAADYSWFIHLLDADGNLIAQQDRAPVGGYALTSTWRAGDVVSDRLYFPGVRGDGLQLRVGWVDPATGERLTATDPAGETLADGFAVLALET